MQEHGEDWLAIPGVEAFAQRDCDGTPCVMVIVTGSVDEVREQIPEVVDGFPIVVGDVGDISK